MTDYDFNPYLLMVNHISDEGQSPGGSFPQRYTIYHEVDIITGGPGPAVINDVEYELHYGDVFYRVPGLRNQHFFPYRCYFFVFEPYYTPDAARTFPYEVVNGLSSQKLSSMEPIALFKDAKAPFIGHLKEPEPIIHRAYDIYNNYTSDNPNTLRMRGEFLLLLDDINRALNPNPPQPTVANDYAHYTQTIKAVETAILNLLNRKWTLHEAAEIAHLSPNFFSKVFHALTGLTFTEYVQQAKIKHAVVLLIDTGMSISQISDYLCFCDVTYFQTVFKKYAGVPPQKFRNLIANKGKIE